MFENLTPTTLTFYSLASGLCFCLSIALLVFAQLRRGTLLIRRSAQSFLILSVAFFLSGYGPVMPQWVTVVGTNTLLLTASVVLFSGFSAYQHDIPPPLDHFGAALIVLAIPLFAWWGLVEPDGVKRAIVFSLASAILNGRIAWILLRLLRENRTSIPAMALGVLFGIAALWMLGRAGSLLFADAITIGQRGDNPTTWVTVFWFNILAAAIVAAILALEIQRYKERHTKLTSSGQGHGLERRRSNLQLLWTLVAERLNSNLITTARTRIDPVALLHQLRDESLAPERVLLEIDAVPESLPECSTDDQLLSTVLANLIDNALKYGRRDANITLRARPEKRNGRNGILFVVSNPPGSAGFPDPAHVFKKYYRAPAAHGKTGSGLGLYICEGLARMLGAELQYCPTDDTVAFALWMPC